jgi:DNA invertase Pin-like site-specific DNA recombinase
VAKVGYARVSTADQNPRLQFDALDGAGCLKVYADHTTTAHGALVFGMFALMAEYEAALIRERVAVA